MKTVLYSITVPQPYPQGSSTYPFCTLYLANFRKCFLRGDQNFWEKKSLSSLRNFAHKCQLILSAKTIVKILEIHSFKITLARSFREFLELVQMGLSTYHPSHERSEWL